MVPSGQPFNINAKFKKKTKLRLDYRLIINVLIIITKKYISLWSTIVRPKTCDLRWLTTMTKYSKDAFPRSLIKIFVIRISPVPDSYLTYRDT